MGSAADPAQGQENSVHQQAARSGVPYQASSWRWGSLKGLQEVFKRHTFSSTLQSHPSMSQAGWRWVSPTLKAGEVREDHRIELRVPNPQLSSKGGKVAGIRALEVVYKVQLPV